MSHQQECPPWCRVSVRVGYAFRHGGVGKTALALHWAHRVAGDFSDGQLHVNLRGYDEWDAVDPADALCGFLEALGVPHAQIPASIEARIGLYRSRLAHRRILTVLDNARDSAQVRPLLPGTGGCVVVVTSRDELSNLVAAQCARPLSLNVLTRDESMSLLASRIGARRLAAEPAAVADITGATGRLPLALSIVAARVALHPGFPLDAFAAELRSDEARLDAFSDGHVRAVFSWSYLALSRPAARLFRLLGLHPGPDMTADAAAALAGRPEAAITPLLRELTRLHLLTERMPGRYAFHDLLRAYAAELVESSEDADERRGARRRLFDHYLHSAYPAAVLLQPQLIAIEPVPPLPLNTSRSTDDHDAAFAWFAAEHRVLLRAVRQAAETGFEAYAWQLAWALTTFFAPAAYGRISSRSSRPRSPRRSAAVTSQVRPSPIGCWPAPRPASATSPRRRFGCGAHSTCTGASATRLARRKPCTITPNSATCAASRVTGWRTATRRCGYIGWPETAPGRRGR